MKLDQIEQELKNSKYNFLRTNPHLGCNIILLGLGGSHAYGTSIEGSDLDIRGIALNSSREILLGQDFGQVSGSENTDVCVYSFNKMIRLLAECNPNCIEILGLKPEYYLYVSPVGNLLLENKNVFCLQELGILMAAISAHKCAAWKSLWTHIGVNKEKNI